MGEALDVAKAFYDRFEAGDLDGANDLFADECAFEMPVGRLTKAEHAAMGETFRAALPDARMDITHTLDGGDEAFVEGRFVGTHKGDLVSPQGTIPASGNTVDLSFADYFLVSGGRIVAHRTYWDQVSMMSQLGAMPPL